ncbi:toxin-antitoxin system YwqK family antitoxin [Carboxylicivirga sp. N1Y90]|uniref:toxin-antitoxin system YwqK family antitoxin n=1 Tax=Carboxylicivirga fragile TaxID=3417571 RepID=UPI003D34CA61|nr:hypothetical protein [Marinilabiliaceae bacterium N1Y90]
MGRMDFILRIKLMFGYIFYSMVILVILFGGMALFSALGIGDFIIEHFPESILDFFNIFLLFAVIALFLNQDSINGSGLVNRFFSTQVVSNKTNLPASPLKCFFRNVFIFIQPIDFLITLFYPPRSLGDYIVGTKLIVNPSLVGTSVYNFKSFGLYIVTSLMASAIPSFIIIFAIQNVGDIPTREYEEGTSLKYHEEVVNNSTKITRAYSQDSILRIEFTMKNGKYEGVYREWNENGLPQTEIEYVNGVRNGITNSYHSNVSTSLF